ncbi:MAG: glycoside hydrolase family 32 protein [Clostridiales bacterium]|nr:glycoside hydrolase family 32 protein [Clostridiales bacterium]
MTRKMDLKAPYLALPVKTGQNQSFLEIFADDEKKYELLVSDCPEKTCDYDCWLYLPDCVGKTIELKGDLSEAYFAQIRQAEAAEQTPLTRPLLHFTADRGWINDPNGLVFHDGVYHLFFQYNPADIEWGNMSWGHAVSTDLLHFCQTDTVLWPDETGTMFSGSGLVNQQGLLDLPEDALVFFYTAAGGTNPWSRKSASCLVGAGVDEGCTNGEMSHTENQTEANQTEANQETDLAAENDMEKYFTQRIAVSVDGGRTLRKLHQEALGVLEPDSRDPQVFWHAASNAYVMALWIQGEEIGILRSLDLQNWEMSDRFTLPGAFECPNLFCLPSADAMESSVYRDRDLTELNANQDVDPSDLSVIRDPDADSAEKSVQWVLTVADGSYYLGDFDGYHFTSDGVRRKSYLTELPYAAQVYNGISDRTVLVAWLRTRNEGHLYTGAMSLPRELGLTMRKGKQMLQLRPVREYETSKRKRNLPFEKKNGSLILEIRDEAVTELVLNPSGENPLTVEFFGNILTIGKETMLFQADGAVHAANDAGMPDVLESESVPNDAGAPDAQESVPDDAGTPDAHDDTNKLDMQKCTALPEPFTEVHLLIDRQILEVYGNDCTQTAYFETGSDQLTGTIRVMGCEGTPEVYQWTPQTCPDNAD